MEHIIVTDLDNGYFQLVAEEGYELFAKNLNRVVSEAVVHRENFDNFEARK